MTHKNKSSLEIIGKHIKYLGDIINSLSPLVRKEAKDFSKKLWDILTSEKEENEKITIIENVIKSFKIQITLILKKEDSLNENDKNLIKVLFELPKRFDVNLLIKGIKGKLEQKDITFLLSEINHIENIETREIIRSIIEVNINKRHNFQNINQISNEIIERIIKSDEPLKDILAEIIRKNKVEIIPYILTIVLDSDDIIETDKIEIFEILYERFYAVFRYVSGIDDNQMSKIDDFVKRRKKVSGINDEKIPRTKEIDNRDRVETLLEVLKIKNKVFRGLVFKYLFSESNIIGLIGKILNNKKIDNIEIDENTKDNIKDFFGTNIKNLNDAKKWEIFNKKETLIENILKISSLIIKRKLAEYKRKQSREKFLKELLLDLLGVNKKLNKIPTENQMISIISNTGNYEGRKLLYDIYFKWLKGIEIEYNPVFDLIIKEGTLNESSDFKNEKLVKLLKEHGNKKGVFNNLKFVLRNISLKNISEIFSTSLYGIITEKNLGEVKGIFKDFSEDGEVNKDGMMKLLSCDRKTLELIRKIFPDMKCSDIAKNSILLELLKIEDKKDFRKIRKNLVLFNKLFENIKKDDFKNYYFCEALRTFNSNNLEIFINLKYKKEVYREKIDGIIESYLKQRGFEEKEENGNIIIAPNKDNTNLAPQTINVNYQVSSFRKVFETLEIKFKVDNFNLNIGNTFFTSENITIEELFISIFKCIDQGIFSSIDKINRGAVSAELNMEIISKIWRKLERILGKDFELKNLIYYGLMENIPIHSFISNLTDKQKPKG